MIRKKKVAKQHCSFPAEIASLQAILDFSEDWMLRCHVNKKVAGEYRLVIEEVFLKLIETAPDGSILTIEGRQGFGRVTLKMRCFGSPVDLTAESDSDIGSRILEQYQDHFKQSYSDGTNIILFFTNSLHYVQIGTLIAFILSALTALIMYLVCGESARLTLIDNVVYPFCEIYASYMEVLAVPVVFFSIVVIIVRLRLEFEKSREMIHVFLEYLLSSAAAILIAYTVVTVMIGGSPFVGAFVDDASGTETVLKVRQFLEQFEYAGLGSDSQFSSPIQVIVLAMLVGIAIAGSFGSSGTWLRNACYALNGLFSQILSILYSVIPFFLYFSLLSLWIYDGVSLLLYILLTILSLILPLIFLFLVYSIHLGISGISPIRFLREYKDILWENLKIGSNIDALPYNNRVLSRKLSMPSTRRKNFLSIGAIANMDGNCLLISSFTFIMCVLLNVNTTPKLVISIFLIILIISIGAPNEPGSFLIGLIFIMSYLGIANEYYDFLIMTECVLGAAYSSINSIGDIVSIAVDDQWHKRRAKKEAGSR